MTFQPNRRKRDNPRASSSRINVVADPQAPSQQSRPSLDGSTTPAVRATAPVLRVTAPIRATAPVLRPIPPVPGLTASVNGASVQAPQEMQPTQPTQPTHPTHRTHRTHRTHLTQPTQSTQPTQPTHVAPSTPRRMPQQAPTGLRSALAPPLRPGEVHPTADHTQSRVLMHSTVPSEFPRCIHLTQILDFLITHRPQNVDPFSEDCMDLYHRKYSRSRRNAMQNASNQNPQQNIIPAAISHMAAHPVPDVPAAGGHASTKPASVSAVPQSTGAQVASAPTPAPTIIGTTTNGAHGPRDEIIDVDAEIAEDVKQVPPAAGSTVANTNGAPLPAKFTNPRGEPAPDVDVIEVPDDVELEEVHSYMDWQQTLERKISRRAIAFSNLRKKLDGVSDEKRGYVIWTRPTRGDGSDIFLPPSIGHRVKVFLDPKTQKLAQIHLNAVRFLWMFLVANPCSGAIFNHGIGYPRQHLVLMFAQLYVSTYDKGPNRKRVLVIFPASSMALWRSAALQFQQGEFHVSIVQENSWYDDVMLWHKRGGVLLCTFRDYEGISQNGVDKEKRDEVMVHLCRPGPDIVVVDEASRLTACDGMTLGLLGRIATKARLSLTSVSLGGNMTTVGAIAEWACPSFLGSEAEYWARFVKPITLGHSCRSSTKEGARAYVVACRLWHQFKKIMLSIGADERRNALQGLGKEMFETGVVVNLGKSEAKIYQLMSLMLGEMIKQGEMSSFIASQLLSVAGTSIQAMLKLIEGLDEVRNDLVEGFDDSKRSWLNPTGKHYANMTSKFVNVHKCLLNLRQKIEGAMSQEASGTPSRKLEAMKVMAEIFLKEKERVVIFSCYYEVREEIFKVLKAMNLEEGKERVIFRCDSNEEGEREEEITCFNKAQEEAVLVAPYGMSIECLEDCGWGFVNATRVLVMDVCWFVSPLAQALSRVHNYVPVGALKVDVFHLWAYGTVDMKSEELAMERYKMLNETFGQRRGIEDSGIVVPSQSRFRAFLLEPEVDENLLEYPKSEESVAASCPTISRDGIDSLHPRAVMLRNISDKLLSMRLDEGRFGLRKFTYILPSRYRMYSDVLEVSFGGPSASETDKRDDRRDDHGSIDEFLDSLAFRLCSLHRAVDGLNGNVDAGLWGIIGEGTSVYCDVDVKRHELLQVWKQYFSLYEEAGLQKGGQRQLGPGRNGPNVEMIEDRSESHSQGGVVDVDGGCGDCGKDRDRRSGGWQGGDLQGTGPGPRGPGDIEHLDGRQRGEHGRGRNSGHGERVRGPPPQQDEWVDDRDEQHTGRKRRRSYDNEHGDPHRRSNGLDRSLPPSPNRPRADKFPDVRGGRAHGGPDRGPHLPQDGGIERGGRHGSGHGHPLRGRGREGDNDCRRSSGGSFQRPDSPAAPAAGRGQARTKPAWHRNS